MGWLFKKKKKSILSNLTEEQKKRLEEEAKKIREGFRVIQIVEDPTTGNLSVNTIQNIRTPIEAVGILYKGLKLMEHEFNKIQQNRIIT